MRRTSVISASMAIASILVWAGTGLSQELHVDPISRHFFPPGLILEHQDQLKLTTSQKQAVQAAAERLQKELPGLENGLQTEMASLNAILGADEPDVEKALAQLDKVLDRERDIKRAHVRLALKLRRALSAEQRKQLDQLKKSLPKVDRAVQQRLHEKIQRLHGLVKARAEAGHPPGEALRLFGETFPKLMQQGKVAEAEALLDEWTAKLEKESQ